MSAKTLPLLGLILVTFSLPLAACIGDDTVVPSADAGVDATVDATVHDASNDALTDGSATTDGDTSDAPNDATGR